jgi:hypothetical protein
MNRRRRYSEKAEGELEQLSRAIELVQRLAKEARSTGNLKYLDDVTRFRKLSQTIRDDIDELGWVEPDGWLRLAARVDAELGRLRRALDQSSDWFTPAPASIRTLTEHEAGR